MSNHLHIVMTDMRGEAPLFYQLLDQTITNLLKRHFPDLEGEVWNTSQPSASGLVSKWTQWRLSVQTRRHGTADGPREVARVRVRSNEVAVACRDDGVRAPSLEHWSRDELMTMLRGELKRIPAPKTRSG